ncbi:MAG: hypothetical protein Q9227_001740 [Pyrenula ochraceoflavens]
MNLIEDTSSDNEEGGVSLAKNDSAEFKVNEEFARKLEYNKRREELRHLEEKFHDTTRKRKRREEAEAESGNTDASTSTSEDEDDAGELATEALDSEIHATLNAIRSKDPRVYDKNTTFYSELDSTTPNNEPARKRPKAMSLRDYHREKLLNDESEDEGEEHVEGQQPSYNQEQEALKKEIVGEINAAATGHDHSDSEVSEGHFDFVIKKPFHKDTKTPRTAQLNIEGAEKDPETFLSNFMASRAWVPSAQSNFQPFESDDEEEEKRAEEFEEAYNFRFEDPERANEKLVSYARDTNDRYSVRRPQESGRKKRRDAEKAQKDIIKQERAEQKARLKKLRIDDLHEKVRRIRRAAGLNGAELDGNDWSKLVNGDWDDAQWETEMQRRFGDRYYADEDFHSESDEDPREAKTRLKKPKWNDDIDIKDIVPDFEEYADFSSSDEAGSKRARATNSQKTGSNKDRRKERKEQQREFRKDRERIEQLVDQEVDLEHPLSAKPSKKAGIFRYRETSPVSFGLTHKDILLAGDKSLNQYAGLKKLAAYRDPVKKQKDQKHFKKKAKLREWRNETFGNENDTHENLTPTANGNTSNEGGQDAAQNDMHPLARPDNTGDDANESSAGTGRRKPKRQRKTGRTQTKKVKNSA